jgi:hypothetical protein
MLLKTPIAMEVLEHTVAHACNDFGNRSQPGEAGKGAAPLDRSLMALRDFVQELDSIFDGAPGSQHPDFALCRAMAMTLSDMLEGIAASLLRDRS